MFQILEFITSLRARWYWWKWRHIPPIRNLKHFFRYHLDSKYRKDIDQIPF